MSVTSNTAHNQFYSDCVAHIKCTVLAKRNPQNPRVVLVFIEDGIAIFRARRGISDIRDGHGCLSATDNLINPSRIATNFYCAFVTARHGQIPVQWSLVSVQLSFSD